jgi:Tfp pilus assembly protein FimT
VIELVVVVAIIGIIIAVSMPLFLSYWRASTLKAGAEEMAAILNSARQLAIKENTTVCVRNDGTRVQYHIKPPPPSIVAVCEAAAWTGVGTDGSGNMRLANNVTVSGGTNVVFTYLGAASTAGTYTVTNPVDGRTMSVIVASTGRVRIGP